MLTRQVIDAGIMARDMPALVFWAALSNHSCWDWARWALASSIPCCICALGGDAGRPARTVFGGAGRDPLARDLPLGEAMARLDGDCAEIQALPSTPCWSPPARSFRPAGGLALMVALDWRMAPAARWRRPSCGFCRARPPICCPARRLRGARRADSRWPRRCRRPRATLVRPPFAALDQQGQVPAPSTRRSPGCSASGSGRKPWRGQPDHHRHPARRDPCWSGVAGGAATGRSARWSRSGLCRDDVGAVAGTCWGFITHQAAPASPPTSWAASSPAPARYRRGPCRPALTCIEGAPPAASTTRSPGDIPPASACCWTTPRASGSRG